MIYLMIFHMNDILMLIIVMDIIPNYNYSWSAINLFELKIICL